MAIGSLTKKWRRLGHELGFGVGIAHGFATLGTMSPRGGLQRQFNCLEAIKIKS
jgi:hypothetical protein